LFITDQNGGEKLKFFFFSLISDEITKQVYFSFFNILLLQYLVFSVHILIYT